MVINIIYEYYMLTHLIAARSDKYNGSSITAVISNQSY